MTNGGKNTPKEKMPYSPLTIAAPHNRRAKIPIAVPAAENRLSLDQETDLSTRIGDLLYKIEQEFGQPVADREYEGAQRRVKAINNGHTPAQLQQLVHAHLQTFYNSGGEEYVPRRLPKQ